MTASHETICAVLRAGARARTEISVGDRDSEAVAVLERFLGHEPAGATAALRAWMDGLASRPAETPRFGVLEYVVLLAVVRCDPLLAGTELDDDRPRAARLLVSLREHLVGERVSIDQIGHLRLPRRYLASQTRDAQALHAAAFRRLDERPSSALVNLYLGYVPRPHDLIVVACLAAAWLHPATFPLAAGLLYGYLFGTTIEHLIHRHLGHATRRRVAFLEDLLTVLGPPGRLVFRGVAAIAFRHGIVHHASYAASYVDPHGFTGGPPARKGRIDAMVGDRPTREIEDIVGSRYGTSLAHPVNDAMAIAIGSAVAAWLVATVPAGAHAAFTVPFVTASATASMLFLALSHWVHPYLHMTREAGLEAAGPLMRCFLRSRYAAHIARAHYLHHRDASVNQNLAIGADFVLGYRMSSIESVLRLRRMGALY